MCPDCPVMLVHVRNREARFDVISRHSGKAVTMWNRACGKRLLKEIMKKDYIYHFRVFEIIKSQNQNMKEIEN